MNWKGRILPTVQQKPTNFKSLKTHSHQKYITCMVAKLVDLGGKGTNDIMIYLIFYAYRKIVASKLIYSLPPYKSATQQTVVNQVQYGIVSLNYLIMMDIKIQLQVIVVSILCFGLLMVALYIMLIGPIREILRDETAFTESFQKINGMIINIFYLILIKRLYQ